VLDAFSGVARDDAESDAECSFSEPAARVLILTPGNVILLLAAELIPEVDHLADVVLHVGSTTDDHVETGFGIAAHP
jgi:hypothetical protein